MKQKRVIKVDNERLNKLKTNESTACLDWALKQPNINELQSTIQQMSFIDLHFEIENIEMQGVCHVLSNNQMQLKFISIANGLLIFQETNCVVLSDCVIQKKKFHCHHNQLFLIIVQNNGGRLILIFQHPMSQKEWFKILKLSAKQIDFLKKYRIQNNICLNFYSVSHKKKKKKFAAQIINRKTFKFYDLQEIVNNYIKILRNTNIQNVFPIISIFDDNDILYLLTDQFIGNSFEQLLQQKQIEKKLYSKLKIDYIQSENHCYSGGFSIYNFFCSLEFKKFIRRRSFSWKFKSRQYHYCQLIRIARSLCYQSNLQSKIYCLSQLYKQKQVDYYVNAVPDYLLAPEINENQTPSVCSDIYQLGIILMLVSFYSVSQKINNSFIERVINNKEILITQQQIKFQKCQDSDFPFLFSACQLDLIKQMTESDPNRRIQVQDALKHAWFINTKDKIKTQKQNFNRHLPSLKTIIEMVEQSDYDIKRKSLQSTAINLKLPLSKYEFSPFTQQQPELSPLRKTSESLNEVLDEEHQISNLIDQLNNKQYIMLPSQYNHFNQAKSQLRLVQTENNLDQLHI